MNNLEAIVGAVGAVVALGGVVVAWYFARRARRLGSAAFVNEYFRDLRAWASEAINTLSEAEYECNASEGNAASGPSETTTQLRHRLSALADRGRFFFPNVDDDGYGRHKPSAYRGYRHPILSFLVAAERALDGTLGGFSSRHEALHEMRREFVSYAQRILAPDLQNRELQKVVRVSYPSRYDDLALGGLIPSPVDLLGATALLERGPYCRESEGT